MESSLLSALYGEQHFGHPAVILQLLDGTLHHGPHGCLSQVVAAWGPFNYHFSNARVLCGIDPFFHIEQVFNDAIEALRVSYRKMNPFCVPFATTNMGSAMLAMDLVCENYLFLDNICSILSGCDTYKE